MRSLSIIAVSLLAAACSQQSAPLPAVAGATTASTPAAPLATAQAAKTSGEQAFTMCVACHSRDAGGPQRMGPNLHDVVGRKAGSNPGFNYSPALKASNITWDAAQLDAYLAAPAKHVPGTRMVIAVPDPARRQALIEYLSAP